MTKASVTTEQISASEMVQSLTGFEEIAIEKTMHVDPYKDGEAKPIRVLRALVFVLELRKGLDTAAARQAAMDMPMSAVNGICQHRSGHQSDCDAPVRDIHRGMLRTSAASGLTG